jgi:hypothetical protein
MLTKNSVLHSNEVNSVVSDMHSRNVRPRTRRVAANFARVTAAGAAVSGISSTVCNNPHTLILYLFHLDSTTSALGYSGCFSITGDVV